MSRAARVPGSRGGFRVARPGTPVAQMMSVAYPGEPDGKGFDGKVCVAVIVLVVIGFWLANTNRYSSSGSANGALLIVFAPVLGCCACYCRSCTKTTTPYMDKLARAQEAGSGTVVGVGVMGMAIGD